MPSIIGVDEHESSPAVDPVCQVVQQRHCCD